MDNEMIREQPESLEQVQTDCEHGTSTSSPDGSLGKFKDAQSLLSAYNTLQAEFTKKCQKLSALEKQEEKVIFEDENWNKEVSTFLERYPEAKKYSKEISECILSNPDLKTKKNALELAWSGIATQKYVAPDKLIKDETFLKEYVYSNDEIKKQVLNLYMSELKSAPPVISGGFGQQITAKPIEKISSLSDAKKIVEKLFKY